MLHVFIAGFLFYYVYTLCLWMKEVDRGHRMSVTIGDLITLVAISMFWLILIVISLFNWILDCISSSCDVDIYTRKD